MGVVAHTSIIPAPLRLKQEDFMFNASLGNIVRLSQKQRRRHSNTMILNVEKIFPTQKIAIFGFRSDPFPMNF
jgi:hypothetical protein